MDNSFFTQCACVIFENAPRIEAVERALDGWHLSGNPNLGEGEHGWALCAAGFMISLRSGAFAVVDVVDRPWPEPAAVAAAPALDEAFGLGAFGPGATPGALSRAADQPWLWDGAAAASRHRAFVRLRTGHVVAEGAPQELPTGYDPVYELATLSELAQALLRLPDALALFVPAGEALRSREQVDAAMGRKIGVAVPPFELWTNVRAVALGREGDVDWLAMDVVGMNQLRQPDQEAIFASGQEDPAAVEALLRNACLNLVMGRRLAAGATSQDGAGRRWSAAAVTGVVAPPRPVLRWLPEGSARISEPMLAKLAALAGAGAA